MVAGEGCKVEGRAVVQIGVVDACVDDALSTRMTVYEKDWTRSRLNLRSQWLEISRTTRLEAMPPHSPRTPSRSSRKTGLDIVGQLLQLGP